MKKLLIFSFLIILSTSNIFSQSGWFWINPQPQGNTLNDIKFSGSVGIAVGNFGTILKSTNAGLNWVNLYFTERYNLHSVSVINEFIYYVCGDSGKFYRTINGGSNWVSLQLTGKLNDLSFINENTGCICTDNNRIYRTSDGGTNWTYQNTSGSSLNIVSIEFVNDSIVHAVKDRATFLTSFDRGINWSETILGPYYNPTDLDFVNSNTGYITGTYYYPNPPSSYNVLLYTQNGGVSWSEIYSNNAISNLRKIKMFNETFGLMIGRNTFEDDFFYVTNNGINWSQLNTVPAGQPLNSISFISNSTVFMAGNGGEIFHSTNSAINWESRIPGLKFDYYDICFVNEQTGWVIGPSYIFNAGDGVIVKTTNSGLNWNLNYSSSETLYSVYFVNSETGFAAGNNGLILKTTDSGGNWIILTSNTSQSIRDIVFTNINSGFAIGTNGLSLRTTNSGQNWSQMSLSSTYLLFESQLH